MKSTTHFYVEVSEIGANQILVTGDVAHPNSYRVSRAGTQMARRFAQRRADQHRTARCSNVRVMRSWPDRSPAGRLDFSNLRGDASRDTRLENGDIVFVPPRGPQVRVAGAVLRPATYEFAGTETVGEVIRLAGGFKENADQRRVQIERLVPVSERTTPGSDRRIVDVAEDFFATSRVYSRNVVARPRSSGCRSHRVVVQRQQWTPGLVAFSPSTHLFDALRRAGGLKPDSYLGLVLSW